MASAWTVRELVFASFLTGRCLRYNDIVYMLNKLKPLAKGRS